MKFDVKANYKTKKSQDNANAKKIKTQRHEGQKEVKKILHMFFFVYFVPLW